MHRPRAATRRFWLATLLPALLLVPTTIQPHASARAAGACDVDMGRMAPDAEEQALLTSVNAYRAASGLGPLHFSYALTRAALWKSGNMAAHGPDTHDDAFRSWEDRFTDCGYAAAGAWTGENIAAGNDGAAATLRQWQNSPPHNANLLNPAYTAVGLKRVRSSDPHDTYGTYWTMDFGSGLDRDLLTALNAPATPAYAAATQPGDAED